MITSFSENAILQASETPEESIEVIRRKLNNLLEELDYTLSSLTLDNFTIETRNAINDIAAKAALAEEGISRNANNYGYTTPIGGGLSTWKFDFGGYTKIGNIVIVHVRMHPNDNFTFPETGLLNDIKGGFPKPRADSTDNDRDATSFVALSAVTTATGVIINASITGNGYLHLRGKPGDKIPKDNKVDFSGIYLTNE